MDDETNYEVWQNDELMAYSDSLDEAIHYAVMYSQDGPVKLVCAVIVRKEMTLRVQHVPEPN